MEKAKEVNTNIIEVFGTLKIDSIKLTSWDGPQTIMAETLEVETSAKIIWK